MIVQRTGYHYIGLLQLLQLQKLLLNVYLTDLYSTGFIETEIMKCASLYGTYKIISMQKEVCNIF